MQPLGELGAATPEFGTLDAWYRDHVQGGPGSFVLPADGYADFGRAIRRKFVMEISCDTNAGDRAPVLRATRNDPARTAAPPR